MCSSVVNSRLGCCWLGAEVGLAMYSIGGIARSSRASRSSSEMYDEVEEDV